MHSLNYIVILLFSLMVLLVGVAFTRSGGNMKSYFAAGGNLPWWLSGLSLFMSFFSAGTFVVWGSIAYEHGWVAISIQWVMGIGGFFIGYFIAPRWRKTGALTVGEYLGNRFGKNLQQFYSYVFLIMSFLTTGAFLYPVARLVNVSTGFSIEWAIVSLGLLIILYTSAGGLWAVIVTDVLQFVILFAAVIIVIPLALAEVGGIEKFISHTPEGFFNLVSGEYTWLFLGAFFLYNTIFIGGNWAYVQRYTSVRSPEDARKVGWLFGGLYMISPVLWMIPPMIFRVVNSELSDLENEGAYMMICKAVLPNGMLGLMLGGMIFATASSVNTTLNMSAAVFTNDIFKKFFSPVSNRQLMWTARISTAAFGLITIGIALLVPAFGGIVNVVISVGALTGAPLFAPAIWALFSRKQTAFSILCTTLVSLSINVIFKFVTPFLPAPWTISLDRAEEMFVGVCVPLLILALFELRKIESVITIHKPQPKSKVPEEEKDISQNRFAIRVLGIAIACTGVFISILGILGENQEPLVFSMGIFLAIGGLWLRHHNRA